jgi:hypothetical protein
MKRIACLLVVSLLIGCGGGGGGGSSSGSTPPSFGVVSSSPANDQTEIPVSGNFKVTFNQDVNPATIANGITARSFIGNLPGTVSYDASTKTATFTPGTPFAPLTEYTVTVSTNIKSVTGESLSVSYISHFTTVTAFWVIDQTLNNYYLMNATKVAEGIHCYIYLENGKTVQQTDIDRIKNNFDSITYPSVLTNFGNEPNPGADGLPKVFIVLLDIRDGYVPGGGFVGGYFVPNNEKSNVDAYPLGYPSNQKDVIFTDINPLNPSSPEFDKNLAHEFQHMVHWEQKNRLLGIDDDIWLNEAMSEVAPFYAGYGPSYNRVLDFETFKNWSDSLTVWKSDIPDYAAVYMWAQYMADRFPSGVFKNILTSPSAGIASVNSYLNTAYPGLTFSTVFRDWSIAVLSGKDILWTGHPEWSYKSISTKQGTYNNIPLPGILTQNNLNISQHSSLPPWSIDFYWYQTTLVNPTFTINFGPPPQASFIDGETGTLSFNMVPGQSYPYDNVAIVILQNAIGTTTLHPTSTNQTAQSTESTILTPSEKLKAVSENAITKKLAEITGEPIPICIQDHLLEQEKVVRELIRKKHNAQ